MALPNNAAEDTGDEISIYLMNMEKYRQDDLNAFDDSIMEAKATMGSDCAEYRKLRVNASIDRQDKAKRFKIAVSDLQADFQMCKTELAKTKQELQMATLHLQAAAEKNVAATDKV